MRDLGQQKVTEKDKGKRRGEKEIAYPLMDIGQEAIRNNEDSRRIETKEAKNSKGKSQGSRFPRQRTEEF